MMPGVPNTKHRVSQVAPRLSFSEIESFKWECSELAASQQKHGVPSSKYELHYSALTIQSFYRRHEARHLVWGKSGIRDHAAAETLQSWTRGCLCRQVLKEVKRAAEADAAVRIQAHARRRAAKDAKVRAKHTLQALKIQGFFRTLKRRRKAWALEEKKVTHAVTRIQKHVRRYCVQKQLPALQAGMLKVKQLLQLSSREMSKRLHQLQLTSDREIRKCENLQGEVLNLGMLMQVSGKTTEALSLYTRVLRCNSDSVPALYLRLIAGMGDPSAREEGYRDLEKARDLRKSNARSGLAIVKTFYWYFKARIGHSDEYRTSMFLAISRGLISGDRERAEVLWNRSLRLAPDRVEVTRTHCRYNEFWIQEEKLVKTWTRCKVGYVRIKQKGDSFIFALLDGNKEHEDKSVLPLVIAHDELNTILKDTRFEPEAANDYMSHTEMVRLAHRIRKIALDRHRWKLLVPNLSRHREALKLKMRGERLLVSVQSGVRGLIARREAARERARMNVLARQQVDVIKLRSLRNTKRQRKAACATIIQSRARGILGRLRQVVCRSAAIMIQRHLRGYISRQRVMFLRQELSLGSNVNRIFVGTRRTAGKFVIVECLKAGTTFLVKAIDTKANKCSQGIITQHQMNCIARKKSIKEVAVDRHIQLVALLEDLVFRKVNNRMQEGIARQLSYQSVQHESL